MGDEPKLDWMYAGPAGHVNPDEYLMGRAVDKTFEQFKLGGADIASSQELPAPILPRSKSSVPGYQVDISRKVQEDPLLAIRKREEERRATLREQYLIQQRLASQGKKQGSEQKGKDSVKGKAHVKTREKDLDEKLAEKLMKFQSKKALSLDERIAEKLRKLQRREQGDSSSSSSSSSSSCSSSSSSSSESESESESPARDAVKHYREARSSQHKSNDRTTEAKLSSNRSEHPTRSRASDADEDRKKDRSWNRSRRSRSRSRSRRSRSRSRSRRSRSRSRSRRSRSRSRERYSHRSEKSRYSKESSRYDERRHNRGSPPEVDSRSRDRREPRKDEGPGAQRSQPSYQRNKPKLALSEEELERRRQEMMQHAVVRDEERKDKVEKYRIEAAKEDAELNAARPKEAAFVKKQLATVTAQTSVEARIKANVFNIQRSGNAMDSNFARR